MIIITIIITFFVFAALGMPIAFAMGMASLTAILVAGMDFMLMPGKMVHAVDSFPLMAIPLFMLAGQLMLRGGIMDPLIDFVNAIIGRVRGGLAHVTVASAMLFSSVSGVAVADATALGGTLGPALSKTYPRPFAASIVAAASCMGPIIPPSGAMIVYAVMAGNVSVAGFQCDLPGVDIAGASGGLLEQHEYQTSNSKSRVLSFSMQAIPIPVGSGSLLTINYNNPTNAFIARFFGETVNINSKVKNGFIKTIFGSSGVGISYKDNGIIIGYGLYFYGTGGWTNGLDLSINF